MPTRTLIDEWIRLQELRKWQVMPYVAKSYYYARKWGCPNNNHNRPVNLWHPERRI